MSPSPDRGNPHLIACFVSPHGFGHASRTAALIDAVHRLEPDVRFSIYTTVPEWFFSDSLNVPFQYHPVHTDIGLVQKNAFEEDIDLTLQRLDEFLPFNPRLVNELVRSLRSNPADLVVCDIAPLGIAAGKGAGVKTLLIENFTWDWIYRGYPAVSERMERHIRYLERFFHAADYHIQTEPLCRKNTCDLSVGPVSRRFRNDPEKTRKSLGVPPSERMILVSTGGIPESYGFLEKLRRMSGFFFVLPGAGATQTVIGNTVLLPHRSDYFHPDLVCASDVVVGKAGYSTIAEVYAAGVPFGYVTRPGFPENAGLVEFIRSNIPALAIDESDFRAGRWLEELPALSEMPKNEATAGNEAKRAAEFICSILA